MRLIWNWNLDQWAAITQALSVALVVAVAVGFVVTTTLPVLGAAIIGLGLGCCVAYAVVDRLDRSFLHWHKEHQTETNRELNTDIAEKLAEKEAEIEAVK